MSEVNPVLDFPAVPPGILRDGARIALVDFEIAHPHKASGLRIAVRGFGFVKFNDVEQMLLALRIAVLDRVHPAETPFDLEWLENSLFQFLIWLKFREADEFVVDARQVPLLQDNHEPPVVVAAAEEDRAASEQAVE